MKGQPIVRFAWMAAVFFFVVLGVWPIVAPRSFYDILATFPPYNEHLMRDIGVFTVGVGAALLASLRWTDGLLVALSGATVASILHVGSHVIDRDLGGKPTDIPLLALLALLLISGTMARAQEVRQ